MERLYDFAAVAACPWCGASPLKPTSVSVDSNAQPVFTRDGLAGATFGVQETSVEYVCPRGCVVEVRSRVPQGDSDRAAVIRDIVRRHADEALTRRVFEPGTLAEVLGGEEEGSVDQEQLERARSAVEDLDEG